MIITHSDLEVPRKPSKLRAYVCYLFARIGAVEIEKYAARLWKGPYKYLIREVYPLSIFCVWRFPEDDVLVKPCIGNQGYDGEIIHQPSGIIIRVEIGWPIDGERKKQEARDLNEKGRSKSHVWDHDEGKTLVSTRVLETLKKKASNDYSGCFLLIVLNLWPEFFMDTPRDRADFDELINDMRSVPAKAKAVYVILMYPEYVASIGLPPVIEIRKDEQ